MYFRFQNGTQLLKIDDNFAHLANVNNVGDMLFEFTYSVSQRDVVNKGALKVDVKIESRHVAKKPIMGPSQRGHLDTKAIVRNIQSHIIDAKSSLQQKQRFQVAQKTSDITAVINNEIVPQLRSRAPVTEIAHFNRPRLRLVPASQIKENNNPQPVLHRIANSNLVPNLQLALTSSAAEDPRRLMHDMITRQGLDPSHIFTLNARSQSEQSSHGGLTSKKRSHELLTDPASRLLNVHLFPPTADEPPKTTDEVVDTELVHVLDTVPDDTAYVVVPIKITQAALRLDGATTSQLYVIFDLIDGQTNLPIDSVTKVLDVAQHLHVYHTPKLAPSVKFASSDISTRVNLEIKQVDPGATEVEVYKKSLWVTSPEVDDYALIGTYQLTSTEQSLLIQVDKPRNSPVLYRVVPRGRQSTQGFEFTNVAVKPARYNPIAAISLTAHQVDIGIQLEARQIPANVVAIQFLRWNLTTFDSAYTTVGTDVGFIDDSVRQADMLATIDSDVTFDNIYRYVARLIYVDGHTVDFGDATIEFIKPSPGEVDTRVDNLQVSHDTSPNVTFRVSTTVVDTDLDAVKKMLDAQGFSTYFTGDIANQRDQLKKLIAHSIHRIDLTTGHRDNFGILTVAEFDDNVLRKNQVIGPLEYGHKYRYVIYPLLRSPETLFDDFRKEMIDPVTKKSYSYNPAKFLHPVTLKRGTIVTSRGALLRQAKDPMAHGIIGSIASIEVSFDLDTASVTEATARNFDRYLNVVSWKVLGNVVQVDHFVIMKQVHGIRTLLGKTHSEFANGSCQFIHRIEPDDVGAVQYVITPVYSDYRLGAAALTNTLVIEAP